MSIRTTAALTVGLVAALALAACIPDETEPTPVIDYITTPPTYVETPAR